MRAGDGGEAFREAMETVILPRVEAFSPDLVIISAGFDAHRRDPLGNLNLVEADFSWATHKLMEVAQRQPMSASCRCSRAATTSMGSRAQSPRT